MNALEIKTNRKKNGLTQEALAKLLGVSKRTIINYEKGEVIPETKNELLHSIFNKERIDILNEPVENYIKASPNEIEEIEEVIREREKISELDPSQANHQKEIIRLLKIQIQLIKENKNDIDK
jgi:transcriptional regulator with XRE-family HTH domain